ncbi:MAG: superoxide dismutase [Simkaniaceae bacterium]|nr:MAG: superoxide dismutase [Simkaniaceae bacterium]
MAFKQPELPYDLKALAPFVSEEQMDYHYNKHHAAYFKKLNGLIEGKPEEQKELDDVVKSSSGGVFNNAAQAWNHTFFWDCMSPDGGGKPSGELLESIERDFGGLEPFMKQFSDSAATLFGSGWAWLASDAAGKLEIMPLSNADTPLKHNKTPILTLDVWEHAYYIDYRNERPRFIEQFRDVIHWDFAENNYKERS